MRKNYTKDHRKKIRQFINTFKMHGCEILGCSEMEISVMDFHHINASQKDNALRVAAPNNWSIVKIMDEICKCIVVCSNCHRKIHAGVIK